MSLQIYIAQTGERLRADASSFTSTDALRSWIHQTCKIPPQRQILMTARGRPVRVQTIYTDFEIYVYDRQSLSPDAAEPSAVEIQSFALQSPPDTIADQNSLQSWRNLFMARRTWASRIVDKCNAMNDHLIHLYDQIAVMQNSVGVAIENLRSHSGNLERKYLEAKTLGSQMLADQKSLLDDWETSFDNLAAVDARRDLLNIIPSRFFSSLPPDNNATNSSASFSTSNTTFNNDANPSVVPFHSLVLRQDLSKAASLGQKASDELNTRLTKLDQTVQRISAETDALMDLSKATAVTSLKEKDDDRAKMLEEVDTLFRKISNDYEHVLGLPASPKSVSQASKIALIHTRELLPSLLDAANDLSAALTTAAQIKFSTARSSQKHMQTIATIQSTLAEINQQIADLDLGDDGKDGFDLLNFTIQFPVLYGCLLIEAIRRREWSERVSADSGAIAEELAIVRDEEERRRRKWSKAMDMLLSCPIDDAVGNPLGIEVNVQGEGNPWPAIKRGDLDAYIDSLKSNANMFETIDYLKPLIKELDAPARHQSRRTKAFKNGSVCGAGIRASVFPRGDDLLRSLRDDKLRLEDKLKGSESRVRKLEDLLHRQGNMRRNSTNQFGVPFGLDLDKHVQSAVGNTAQLSPQPDGGPSRRSSASSRRWSQNFTEDQNLAQRIVMLEAELGTEKDRSCKLQQDVVSEQQRRKDLCDQKEDAESTKKDLMANLDAQQREFDQERKLWKEERTKLQERLEEVEDELDRLLGSHEQQKTATQQQILTLQSNLQQVKQSSADLEKASKQIDAFKSKFQAQRDKSASLESDVLQLEKALENAKSALAARDNERADVETRLRVVYGCLNPTEQAVADDLSSLVSHVDAAAKQLVSRTSNFDATVTRANENNSLLEAKISKLELECSALRENVHTAEADAGSLRETLSQERGRREAIEAELDHERAELQSLRLEIDNQDGHSDAMKEKIAEQERKHAEVSEKLAFTSGHARNLEQELQEWKTKAQRNEWEEEQLHARIEERNLRARELSERLYRQNARMRSLLEHVGYSIGSQDGIMTVQRVLRSAAASMTLTDVNIAASMQRSFSGPLPQQTESPQKLNELVSWMYNADIAAEASAYSALVQHLDRFDVDVFCETLIKRIKDTEHTARKFQREARAYREKSHRFQNEAHDKIAYRSFKEGDLALFLPTRNQATRPWAAFNVGAPHYFLHEQDTHKLQTRDWLLARITKVEDRVVDLSKSMANLNDRRFLGEMSDGASIDDDNPFQLSDGLRWYLLDASEEKAGAPTTPGLSKTTVASAHVDAKGSVRIKKPLIGNSSATKTLSKSLESRRSSTNSKKGSPQTAPPTIAAAAMTAAAAAAASVAGTAPPSRTNSSQSLPRRDAHAQQHHRETSSNLSNEIIPSSISNDEVRKDQLFGP